MMLYRMAVCRGKEVLICAFFRVIKGGKRHKSRGKEVRMTSELANRTGIGSGVTVIVVGDVISSKECLLQGWPSRSPSAASSKRGVERGKRRITRFVTVKVV